MFKNQAFIFSFSPAVFVFGLERSSRGKIVTEVIMMPTPRPGPDKFGIEHEIKNKAGNRPLTDEEVREEAKRYTDKNHPPR
ncbi:hypothetical protein [Sporomusa aerivorans]|uniref:hypothetical protein n=1 Tax=Sporomusa aerivorans TaxID=204936 RepID=UPI00352A35CB